MSGQDSNNPINSAEKIYGFLFLLLQNLDNDELRRSVKDDPAIRGVHPVSSCLLANISILHEDKQKSSIINDSG